MSYSKTDAGSAASPRRGSDLQPRRRGFVSRSRRGIVGAWRLLTGVTFALAATPVWAAPRAVAMHHEAPTYLPDDTASKIATVTSDGPASAGIVVLTQALAIKETGPKETVKKFGETYAFSPSVFAVYRDEPTRITFRNLQADDIHDFMLTDPTAAVLMKVQLPALADTSYVFTFHREGVFPFYCTVHQPAMSGQILVLPPKHDD